jgi:hypothetical protein
LSFGFEEDLMAKRIQRFNVGSGLAMLAAMFIFLASAALASNVAIAGTDRPPQVPEGYVITPFGYFHPSCVFEIEETERLLADGRVAHADGTVDANAPACGYPHYTPTGSLVSADFRNLSGTNLASKAPVISGWLEYVSATTSTSYGEITATWTVPPLPATDDYQTLFFFPGLEDIDVEDNLSIVQPVLQFGNSEAGGKNYWAIASWNCCMAGTAWYSHLVKVNPGDTILGTIKSMCKKGLNYCADWKVITQDQTISKKTTLTKTAADGQVWNWGFSAVAEVYGVKQCSDWPANDSLVFTVQVYDQNRELISDPGWTGTPAAGGTEPTCNYGLNVTDTQETLEY